MRHACGSRSRFGTCATSSGASPPGPNPAFLADCDTNPLPAPPDPEPRPRRVTLWCGVCGRSHSYTGGRMAGYVESGWPKCCGRTMGFFPADTSETTRPAG